MKMGWRGGQSEGRKWVDSEREQKVPGRAKASAARRGPLSGAVWGEASGGEAGRDVATLGAGAGQGQGAVGGIRIRSLEAGRNGGRCFSKMVDIVSRSRGAARCGG